MNKLKIHTGSGDELDNIRPLWEQLNRLHYQISPHFRERFLQMTWENRKRKLLDKSAKILLLYVPDGKTIVAYAICTIDKEATDSGEMDSLFVREEYRNTGIGKQLMVAALGWFEEQGITNQRLLVAAGNEKVIDFYDHFGFKPEHYVLQRKI